MICRSCCLIILPAAVEGVAVSEKVAAGEHQLPAVVAGGGGGTAWAPITAAGARRRIDDGHSRASWLSVALLIDGPSCVVAHGEEVHPVKAVGCTYMHAEPTICSVMLPSSRQMLTRPPSAARFSSLSTSCTAQSTMRGR
ncbi:hypothetical protein Vretimale_9538 [Volvox reticuliferus]|uniref:Uncharacterized protein n=1 Tax=Volvox reticuliferus TaxID=1737510 RepID=A0A8J4CYQ4_9CHLO|nr:hypothetical protein Vretifemale_19272 [Volvox reticuliferus]GIM05123.1 hypothetical protein Vretimale_9538 [Volvox reticuliferus]